MMVRTSTLDDVGDPDAPPGTRPWAAAIRLQMQALIKDSESSAQHLEVYRKAMEKHEGWRKLTDEDGVFFSTYAEFCKTRVPWGLGHDPAMIDRLIVERKSVQERAAQPLTLLPHGNNQHTTGNKGLDIIKSKPSASGGTDPEYLTARIARDHPDIHERMKAGGYPSVRAAALDAGIVKPRVSIPTTDPAGAVNIIIRNFNHDDLMSLIDLLLEATDRTDR